VFVHFTSSQASGFKQLSEGQKVSYSLENSPQGPHATNVTVSN
jgi:CspA family cold shock protein